MKKFYFAALLAAVVSMPCTAQTENQENGFYILPDGEDVGFMGLDISSNGRYICGTTSMGNMFIADVTTGQSRIIEGENIEARGVSDDGQAVGYASGLYTASAVVFGLEGEPAYLESDGVICTAEDITPDGSLIVGSVSDDRSQAVIWSDGVRTMLPEPTDKWLGFSNLGTVAKYASADGSVIAGYINDEYDTKPATVWVQNRDGSYSSFPICRQFYEPAWGDKPYMVFMPTGMSPNGRYIAVSLIAMGSYSYTPGRYDLETEMLEVYSGTNIRDIQTTGIADDGTLIGYVNGASAMYGRKGIIWKTGDVPQYLSDVYPKSHFADLELSDKTSNSPTQISPDGRYILGYGSTDASSDVITYVFDTQEYSDDYVPSGVSRVETDAEKAAVESVYSLDGKRIHDPLPGINIVKRMNGSAEKVLVK